MLTITTNKAEVKGIAERRITERALPITDFWTKRIVNLLGFSDSDRQTIIHNLRENRAGTTDAERDVTFTAGGVASVVVKVTIRIGQQSGVECFILSIRDVLESRGELDDEQDEQDEQDPEVVGMPHAPAVRVITRQTGFCRYCNQARMIEAPDGLSAADLNELASQECDCDEATRQRERRGENGSSRGMGAEHIQQTGRAASDRVMCDPFHVRGRDRLCHDQDRQTDTQDRHGFRRDDSDPDDIQGQQRRNILKSRRGGGIVKRYFLDYNERQIVHAAVRMDSRRGKSSPFSQRAAEAIRKAKDDMDVGDIAPDVRSVIVDKIYQSIAYDQPWERLGETYCYRGQFYQLRKQFCYLVADYMGLIDARRQRGSRGSG